MKRYLKQEDFLRMILMYILCLGKSWELLAHPGLYTRRSFLVAVGAYGEPCCFSLEIYHPCPIHLNWVGLTLLELTHLTRSQVVIFNYIILYSNYWTWTQFTGGQLAKEGMAVNMLIDHDDPSQLELIWHSSSRVRISYSWHATNNVPHCKIMRPQTCYT